MNVRYESDKNNMNKVYYDDKYVGLVFDNICRYLDKDIFSLNIN